MELAELIISCITLVAIVAIVFRQGHIAETAIKGMIGSLKILGGHTLFRDERIKRLSHRSKPNKRMDS